MNCRSPASLSDIHHRFLPNRHSPLLVTEDRLGSSFLAPLFNRFVFSSPSRPTKQHRTFACLRSSTRLFSTMRLLYYTGSRLSLTKYLPSNEIPPYAILSHTWGQDTDEVTLKDLEDGVAEGKPGYEKIMFCGNQASRYGLKYFWVDTCCIDKTNQTELTESIVSMYRWYQKSTVCFAYLSDVSSQGGNSQQSPPAWDKALRKSRWFTRGWTLQELLAPASVEFFSEDSVCLGNKKSLEQQIHDITGIHALALRGGVLSQFDIEERFRWTESRTTSREEDLSYCLFGIFDISLPVIYGEGKNRAQRRLRQEIANNTNILIVQPPQGRHFFPFLSTFLFC